MMSIKRVFVKMLDEHKETQHIRDNYYDFLYDVINKQPYLLDEQSKIVNSTGSKLTKWEALISLRNFVHDIMIYMDKSIKDNK